MVVLMRGFFVVVLFWSVVVAFVVVCIGSVVKNKKQCVHCDGSVGRYVGGCIQSNR